MGVSSNNNKCCHTPVNRGCTIIKLWKLILKVTKRLKASSDTKSQEKQYGVFCRVYWNFHWPLMELRAAIVHVTASYRDLDPLQDNDSIYISMMRIRPSLFSYHKKEGDGAIKHDHFWPAISYRGHCIAMSTCWSITCTFSLQLISTHSFHQNSRFTSTLCY